MYLYNARIYTMDPAQPVVSALAVRDGKVIAAGSDSFIQAEFFGQKPGLDLQGQAVLPGLTDAHLHLEYYSLGLKKIDCETATKAECLRRVAERAAKTPAGEWILGHGWNQNNWVEGFGNASELDAQAPGHPVYLTAKSLHAGWANTAALRLAGLDDQSIDPPDGKLGRAADGSLNGILFEGAMDLLAQVMPAPTAQSLAQALLEAQSNLWRMGLTGVHDFDRRRSFQALQILHQQGALRLRVLKSIPLEDLSLAVGLGLRSGFGDDWLRIGSVKLFADGALGPQTAAMIQPYEGSLEDRGVLFLDAEEIVEHGRQAVENGLSLAVHAIGDRANHEVLQAVSRLRQFEQEHALSVGANPKARIRHRIEHVQVIHPDDAGRLAQLRVIASMQPIHAISDMEMADRYWGKRAHTSYAWKLQLDHGAALAFGSDAPVESPNPFLGLHAAVTRQRLDGSPSAEGWIPEQKITLQQAIQAYTVGAAYAAGWEDRVGQLKPGYLADLIVLDQDPFEIPAEELAALTPQATMVGGEWVYQQ